MKTITDNLKNSLAKKTPVYKTTVYLYKRFWNGGAYVYDAPIDITDNVMQYGDLLWKLDNEGFNVWNLSNTTLTFRNERNQWLQGNTKGFFTANYLINQSKIKVKVGAELADGTTEDLYAFSGYISGSPNYDTENKKAIITLISAMSVFDKFSAEDISTTVTEEVLGSDSGDTFTTAQDGVGIILEIKKGATPAAAVELKANIDYTLSDLNTKGTPLTVTLTTALTAGENLYITYKYWYEDETIEWIIKEIMTLCGITSYSIQPAIFESSIQNIWTQNTQAEWEASTLQNIDTTSSVDSFKRKWFLIDDFSGALTWTVTKAVAGHAWAIALEILTGTISATSSGVSVIKSIWMNKYYGTWAFKSWTTLGYHNFIRVFFIAGDEYLGQPRMGYFLKIHSQDSYVKLYRSDGITGQSGADNNSVLLLTIAHRMISTDTIRVTRDTSGKFNVFINGSDNAGAWTATDNGYNTNSRGLYLEKFANAAAITKQYFDSFYFSNAADGTGAIDEHLQSILESIVYDMGVSVVSFGVMKNTYTPISPGDTSVIIETLTADDLEFTSPDPADWQPLDGTGIPQSVIKRYIKVRISLTHIGITTPQFDEFQIYYSTSQILISLVNLTGMSCRQALEILAEMPNYEIVFDTDDKFLFRERLTGLPSILDITGDTNLKEVTNYNQGIARIYNHVRAEFGNYKVDADASADADPNSITKYGTRHYSVQSSQLLPNENANIAYAIAPTILAYTKTPRKRCNIETQFLPQLELGDKITLFYDEPIALRQWRWGDKDVVYGQANIEYYNNEILKNRYNLWDIDMRIEGIRLNLNNYITNFDLTEVV